MVSLLNFEACLLTCSVSGIKGCVCPCLMENFRSRPEVGSLGLHHRAHIWICNSGVRATLNRECATSTTRRTQEVWIGESPPLCVCCSRVSPLSVLPRWVHSLWRAREWDTSGAWAVARWQEGWASAPEAQQGGVTSRAMSNFCRTRHCPGESSWGNQDFSFVYVGDLGFYLFCKMNHI